MEPQQEKEAASQHPETNPDAKPERHHDEDRSKISGGTAHQWIIAVSVFFTLLATLYIAYVAKDTLDKNYEWNRKHYAIEMIKEWNEKTEPYKGEIVKVFPGIYSDKVQKIEVERAKEITEANQQTDEANFKLAGYLVRIFNHLEYMAAAYCDNVADHEIIDTSFKELIVRWHTYFTPYLELERDREKDKKLWKPVSDLVLYWQRHSKGTCQ